MDTETQYETTAKPLTTKAIDRLRVACNVFKLANGTRLGDVFTLTQFLIVAVIFGRLYRRVILILPTQYGKSMAVAIGVLLRITNKKEKWAIIAPTEEKGRIIMDYIIEHIFDNVAFVKLLDYNGGKEKLLQERSKTRITFRGYGEVRVFTADANNTRALEKALTGFGAPNIIIDESAIIPDKAYAMIKRMLGGTQDNFCLEIGNPFFRNHFWRIWTGSRYVKIFINYLTALKEGRYTQDFIDEMHEEALFDILYECHFPTESELLPHGYRQLLSYADIEGSLITQELPLGHDDDGELLDKPILGIDPNHGGSNFTVMVLRFPLTGFAKVVLKKQYSGAKDITGLIVSDAKDLIKKYKIGDYRVAIDGGGVGAGVADELGRDIYCEVVMFGQKPEDATRYANAKAELYWRLRKWVKKENGKLLKHDGFLELKDINYKENSSSKVQMESKEELSARGVASPDTPDALALTFITTTDIADDDGDDII